MTDTDRASSPRQIKSEEDFETFAASSLLAESNQVVSIVDADMIVRWMSKSGAAYGLDLVGRSIVDFVHPEDLARVAQAFEGSETLGDHETSLMANSIVSVRIATPTGDMPFETSGRWVRDDAGTWWLVAMMHEVTTRYGTNQALRKLAAGANEEEAVQAVLTATKHYGGVVGAQMSWHDIDGNVRTSGDLGESPTKVAKLTGNLNELAEHGEEVAIDSSDWGYAVPVTAGSDRLGAFVLWGKGPQPDRDFVFAAVAQLLDLAALAFKRAREIAELERKATTDLVTGLLNRHAFFSALDEPLVASAVMYIDLDAFKAVNDRFGHTLGDRLLAVVSRRLADAVGPDDVIGRLGGDEFGVLCRSVSPAEARQAGQRFVDALNQTFVIDGHHIVTAASVGVAYTRQPMSGRALLDYADQALLEAKAQGKGRSVVLAAL